LLGLGIFLYALGGFAASAETSTSVVSAPTSVLSSTAGIVGTEHWIENDGIRIFVWEKVSGSPAGKKVVMLAHGSATAGRESFDLQVPDKPSYSLMDRLAGEGFDVFALDTRGFGRSTRPDGQMTTAQARDDLNAAVEYVLKMRGVSKLDLVAWSWGTQYGGMFVMDHPDKVNRYVSYAQMHTNSPDVARRRARIAFFRDNPYIVIPEAGWKTRFTSMTPAEVTEPEVLNAFAKIATAIEVKSATGPQLDLATALPMVNPRLITVPTMLIHGQYDDVADTEGLLPFFAQLPNPRKQYVVVPDAGHMMHLQKGHLLFQHAVIGFLTAP